MVLQSIRERLTGILAFFILGILVIPFAFVGVNSYFTSGNENVVARVNDEDITLAQFTQSYTNYRQRMQSIMGAAYDPEQFDTLIARREHLDALINQAVLAQAVDGIGLDVTDERLAREIRELPAFQLDGEFNADLYQNRLTSQGMSVPGFEREMRTQIVMGQLPNGIMSSSFATPTELQEYVRLQDQRRTFRSVPVRPADDPEAPDPAESDIQDYYEQNAAEFRSEEMVVIEYLELSPVDTRSGAELDDEFLRNRFEQQKARFISPEQRLVSHILLEAGATADEASKETARQQAADIAARAREGEDFAQLAREFSQDIGSAENDGDLGWIEPGMMSDSFEEAMYALTLEAPVSEPVQTGFGWHVILLRDIQPAAGMNFEEAREILIAEHQAEESEREFLEKADRMVDLIYEDPTTLEAAALDLGLDVQTAGPFSRAGGEGIAADPGVVSAAFSDLVLAQGSVSDPIDLAENHMVLLRIREHLPAEVRPLAEVRDEIVSRIRAERALDAARERAEALLASVEQGQDLAAAAEQEGLEVTLTEEANRRNFVPDRKVVEEVFQRPAPAEGAMSLQVVEASDGFAVVELQSVRAGSLEEGAALSEQQYRRQLANAAASAEARGFMRQLRNAARVEVFEDRLE
jgi:peptidyl-prolyl cis-trans isomerase D